MNEKVKKIRENNHIIHKNGIEWVCGTNQIIVDDELYTFGFVDDIVKNEDEDEEDAN